MTKVYSKYIIEGRPKNSDDAWKSYEYNPFDEDDLKGAIDEATFYRSVHKSWDFRIVLRHFVTTDTITEH
jgi:hypothetical protein